MKQKKLKLFRGAPILAPPRKLKNFFFKNMSLPDPLGLKKMSKYNRSDCFSTQWDLKERLKLEVKPISWDTKK